MKFPYRERNKWCHSSRHSLAAIPGWKIHHTGDASWKLQSFGSSFYVYLPIHNQGLTFYCLHLLKVTWSILVDVYVMVLETAELAV